MTRTLRRSIVFASSSVLLLTSLWSTGCIDATAPSTPPVSQGISMPQSAASATRSRDLLTSILVYSTTMPSSYLTPQREYVTVARGGTITAGHFSVTIPAGALPQDTYITVAPNSLTQVQVSLEPTGLRFRPGTHASLTFDYAGTNGELSPSLVSAWFNPSTSRWEPLQNGERNEAAKRYTVPLEHFSYYALAK